jgi:hypothetical protein
MKRLHLENGSTVNIDADFNFTPLTPEDFSLLDALVKLVSYWESTHNSDGTQKESTVKDPTGPTGELKK